jgi:hypothetical protein
MIIKINDKILDVELEKNSSVSALNNKIEKGPVKIKMQDYAKMEKVGPLGFDLPRNDEYITAEPGDIILYQGNQLVIYYKPNTWSFTRIGKIINIDMNELQNILNSNNVEVILSN